MLKKLPLGIQNFKKIIEGNYVYVDKTKYIYDLIESASYYFLSRPRRFGKSLLLDTIGEVFSGSKELFKGLWIYDSDFAFNPHPIIRLDMSKLSTKNPETLEESIIFTLRERLESESLVTIGKNPSIIFSDLITKLYQKYNQRVVVLIDEYDKPILDHILDPELADANRKVVQRFYGILKSMDSYLQFVMITGVSKFTKTSIFSELNNLYDITLDEAYAGICGVPVESLDEHFGQHIESLKTLRQFKNLECLHDEILAWYDGYSWDGENRLINPFSLLSFFMRKKFESFWYASGSPKFLINLLKGKPESFLVLKNYKIRERMLDKFDFNSMKVEHLLFQSGYLTVSEVEYISGIAYFTLDMPNYEVKDAFNIQLLEALTESGGDLAEQMQIELKSALKDGDLEKMLDLLRGLFASIPYELHVKKEAYYHSIFYALMTVLGFDMDVEVSTSRGRVDAVLELSDKVFVMEFKYESSDPDISDGEKRKLYDKGFAEAFKQIKEKGYSDKFIGKGKTIYEAAFIFLGRDEIEFEMRCL